MKNFQELGLNNQIIKAIDDLGFEQPSDVQAQAIPLLLEHDRDLVGLAQTGTGKTAAFGFPLLQKIQPNSKQTQGLILSPTRELCLQITNELTQYAKYIKGINVVAVYGGASISTQERQIKRGAQIIVATPGRMKDMQQRGIIDISNIDYCVLDEADEMLNMGFYEDITAILRHSPDTKNTWLFSATMPKEVSKIASKFMTNPLEVTVGTKNQSTNNVAHEYFLIDNRDRYKTLKRLADVNPDIFAVIFCRTKRETQRVAERLTEDGYLAGALHGDLSQNQRDLVMNSFRKHQIRILVATDVAARGIDVNDITHVIHYQLPDEIEIYTHRSGRTGRAGKSGVSMVIVTKKEQRKIKQIERIINQKFEQKTIPSGEEICQVQLLHLAKSIKDTPIDSNIDPYWPALEENFEDFSKEELIKKLFSREFSRFHKYYKNANNLNQNAAESGQGKSSDSEARFFINLGSRDGFEWQSLKDLLREQLQLDNDSLSRVEVKTNFAFFNTAKDQKENVLAAFNDFSHQGREIHVELTHDRPKRKGGGRGRDRSKGGFGKKSHHKGGSGSRSFGNSPRRRSNKSDSNGGRRSNIKSSINRRKRNK